MKRSKAGSGYVTQNLDGSGKESLIILKGGGVWQVKNQRPTNAFL